MSKDGQGTKWRRNIAENFNWLSRAHERYRRQTDGRATAYSEREREFTFDKNDCQAPGARSVNMAMLITSSTFVLSSLLG